MLLVFLLDDGNVLKSIAFSLNSTLGLICFALGGIFGIYLSNYFGLALFGFIWVFIGFLLTMASIEIIFEYKQRHLSHLLPLNLYAQVVSALLYVLTKGGLSAIIWLVGHTGNDFFSLPFKLLAS
jgi:hypothetical protein